MDRFKKIAIMTYKKTHEDAPADVPRWEDLHEVERKFLIEFTKVAIEINKNITI